MTKQTEAMKLALEALTHLQPTALTSFYTIGDRDKAITALREALAEDDSVVWGVDRAPAQQEPVAWVTGLHAGRCVIKTFNPAAILPVGIALYTSPPAQRKPLTDEELYKVFPAIATYTEANKTLYRSIARAIEAAHGIGEKK